MFICEHLATIGQQVQAARFVITKSLIQKPHPYREFYITCGPRFVKEHYLSAFLPVCNYVFKDTVLISITLPATSQIGRREDGT